MRGDERELLRSIERRLDELNEIGRLILSNLTNLNTAVSANTSATNAAVDALGADDDQAGIDAATETIEANTDALNTALGVVPPTSGTEAPAGTVAPIAGGVDAQGEPI